MGLESLIPVVGPALDALSGVASANQARSAFKTRYQDTVNDMRKAGLNPALAYGQGGGNPQTSDLPDVGSSLARAAQSTASAKQARAEAKKTEAETEVLKAQAENLKLQPGLINERIASETHAAGNLAAYRGWLTASERSRAFVGQGTVDAQIRRVLADSEAANLSLPEMRAFANYFKSPVGKASPYLRQGTSTAKDLAAALAAFGLARGGLRGFTRKPTFMR